MRVYSEIVFDHHGHVLSEAFTEYEGTVALAKGGGDNDIKETEAERAAAEVAMTEWNHYQQTFVPLENKFIADVQMGDQDYAYAGGAAAREGRKSMADATKAFVKTAGAHGINPNSGRTVVGLSDAAINEGASTAKGVQTGHLGVNDQHYKGLAAAVSMGRGQATDAQLGLENIASGAAAGAVNDAQNEFADDQAWASSVGTAAGMGVRGYQGRTTTDNTGAEDPRTAIW